MKFFKIIAMTMMAALIVAPAALAAQGRGLTQASEQMGSAQVATPPDANLSHRAPQSQMVPTRAPEMDSQVNKSLSRPKQAATEPGTLPNNGGLKEETTAAMTFTNTANQQAQKHRTVAGADNKTGKEVANNLAHDQKVKAKTKKIRELLKQLRELRAAAVAEARAKKDALKQSPQASPIPRGPAGKGEGWQTPAANSQTPVNPKQSQAVSNQPAMNFDPRLKKRSDNMVRPPAQSLNKPHRRPAGNNVSQSVRKSPFQPPKHVLDKLKSRQVPSPITNNVRNAPVTQEKECGGCPPEKKAPSTPVSSNVTKTEPGPAQKELIQARKKFQQAVMEMEQKAAPTGRQRPDAASSQTQAGSVENRAANQVNEPARQAPNQTEQWNAPASAAQGRLKSRTVVIGRE
jgi:hypothetical protein